MTPWCTPCWLPKNEIQGKVGQGNERRTISGFVVALISFGSRTSSHASLTT
jgi:hypothetical protein